jgi:hypothetical protein
MQFGFLVEYANVHRLGGLNTIDIKNFVAVILLESKASDDYLLVEAIMWSWSAVSFCGDVTARFVAHNVVTDNLIILLVPDRHALH